MIELDENKTYMLCRCFKSKNKPFCDGSHSK
ncbi:MAG TPA: CDGSH iron-sulfur domain-containing protein [Nitrospinaceae bacterium]|nr:CDGSH iron-sulfur domain-containing protein [Nitrospinaceae bacterium]